MFTVEVINLSYILFRNCLFHCNSLLEIRLKLRVKKSTCTDKLIMIVYYVTLCNIT